MYNFAMTLQDIREEVADDAGDQTLSQSRLMRVKTQKKGEEMCSLTIQTNCFISHNEL